MLNSVPIGRKKIFKQNLNEVQTKLIDTSLNSKNYFNIEFPSILKAGKNLIKLKPTSNLNSDSIQIEILDGNNNSIAYEFSTYKDKDNAILINAIIYPDTFNGIGKITLLGIALIDVITFLPITNIKEYNIKWISEIEINKYDVTESPILFNEYPEITIDKNFVPYNNVSFSNDRNVTISGSLENYYYLSSLKLTDENTFDLNRKLGAKDISQSTISEDTQINSDNTENISIKFIQKKDTRIEAPNGFAFEESGNPYISINSYLSGQKFTKELIGAEVTISNIPQPDLPSEFYFSSSLDLSYTTTITKVLNESIAEVYSPYSRKVYKLNSITNKKLYSNYIFSSFSGGDISITFNEEPIYTASEYYNNNATVNIKNLTPFVGIIDKIRIYEKSSSAQIPYALIHEEEILNQNIFIDSSNTIPDYNIGYFKNLNHINNYWNYSGAASYSNTYLLDSIYLNNSNLIPKNSLSIYANHKYQILMNIIGRNENEEDILSIFATGTSVNSNYKIADITIAEDKELNYHNISFLFEPEKTGTFFLNFLTSSGHWYISDIRILSLAEYGFNPKFYSFKLPISPLWPNEIVNFKFEFYNSKNVKSNQFTEIKNIIFDNYTPTVIAGDYNLLTGSLMLGSSIYEGLELFGDASGSYIKSKGYEGIDGGSAGFIFWSGSVKLNETTFYSGSGIEMYAADTKKLSLSTDESKEDKLLMESGSYYSENFFFGNQSYGYISGSNGELELKIYKSGSFANSIISVESYNDYPTDIAAVDIKSRSSLSNIVTGLHINTINSNISSASYNIGINIIAQSEYAVAVGIETNIDSETNSAYGGLFQSHTAGSKNAYGGYFTVSASGGGNAYGGYFTVSASGGGDAYAINCAAGDVYIRDNLIVGDINSQGEIQIDGIRVLTNQQATVSNPTGGAVVDSEARSAINEIINRLQNHGLIA